MAEKQVGTASAVEHGGQVTAAINAPVRLYDEDGRSLVVEHADMQTWLGRGYTLERFDKKATLTEAVAVAKAYADAVRLLSKEPDNVAALEAARVALDEAGAALDRLHRGVMREAPAEDKSVAMRHPASGGGALLAIDPGQVEDFKAHGWAIATGGDK